MGQSFFSRSHGCPDCGGMLSFKDKTCSFCGYKIKITDRYEWADDWVRVSLYAISVIFGGWMGYVLFHMSKPLLAMMISVVISFWYLYRLVPAEYKNRRVECDDSKLAG